MSKLNQMMLVLGAYSFSIPVVSLVHEIGHILAMYSVGITRYTLVINPLAESYASPWMAIPDEHLLLLAASGMIFQLLVFALTSFLLRVRRSVSLLPLQFCLPMSLFNVGGYLAMGSMFEGSDVVLIADAGVPVVIIKLLGWLFFAVGVYSFSRLLPLMGFDKMDSGKNIMIPIFLGIFVYSVAMTVYGYVSGYGTVIGLINMVSSLIISILLTVSMKITPQSIQRIEPTINQSLMILGTGIASVVVCYLIW